MRKKDARAMLDAAHIPSLMEEHLFDMINMISQGETYEEVSEFHVDWLAEMLDDEDDIGWED